MKKGDTITIRSIRNGVMIEPARSQFPMVLIGENLNSVIPNNEIIAFQNAADFIDWIKLHFGVYKVPGWDDTGKEENT